MENLKTLFERLALKNYAPDTAIILGSGLGGLVDDVKVLHRISYHDLEDFPQSKVSGHQSEVILAQIGACDVIILSGRVHYYEDGNAAAMRAPLEALKAVGIKRLILTNAAGSLNEKMAPGSIMQICDHINFAGTSPLIGEGSDQRFVGLSVAYDKALRKRFRKQAKALDIKLHKGVYMWFSGPQFETPAEIKMARKLGADAVGMSTVPEVILARFLGMQVAAFSVITNYGAGMTGQELSHGETKHMAPEGGRVLARLLTAAFEKEFA